MGRQKHAHSRGGDGVGVRGKKHRDREGFLRCEAQGPSDTGSCGWGQYPRYPVPGLVSHLCSYWCTSSCVPITEPGGSGWF